jgi:peptidoglycan/xylan/chitin deacetylase (PgdA/CDA1 family)
MPPFILNFHGIGSAERPYEKGEQPYWLEPDELVKALDLVQSMSGLMDIALTVDDGNSSDCRIMAPELKKRGLAAAFFVTAGKLDRPGYLRATDLQELSSAGFEVGSHGVDHVDWTKCDDARLGREVGHSKSVIEAVLGKPITAAAVPFGSYDRRVLRTLAKAGYRRVFSSDGGPRLTSAWPTPRKSLRAGDDMAALRLEMAGHAFRHRAYSELRVCVKSRLHRSAV